MIISSIIVLIYLALNIYVSNRLSKSFYLNEERRGLHKKLIWFIPFIGPALLYGFWKPNNKVRIETMTKEQRESKNGNFYESGIGLNS
jgi:hypothetical protein